MATYISAPYPGCKVTVALPSADFGNQNVSEQVVDVQRSMVGDTYTYVKSTDRRSLTLVFTLSRKKALELVEFLRVYYRAKLLIEMHDQTQWEASLVSKDFAPRTVGRAGGWPGNEAVEATFELSAKQLA